MKKQVKKESKNKLKVKQDKINITIKNNIQQISPKYKLLSHLAFGLITYLGLILFSIIVFTLGNKSNIIDILLSYPIFIIAFGFVLAIPSLVLSIICKKHDTYKIFNIITIIICIIIFIINLLTWTLGAFLFN